LGHARCVTRRRLDLDALSGESSPNLGHGTLSASAVEVVVEGRRLKLSNLDKVLYPKAGFSKGQVIDYYTRIASGVLPHLRNRTLTLKRYPNGVDQPYFYEKQSPKHRPDWVETQAVWSEGNSGKADSTPPVPRRRSSSAAVSGSGSESCSDSSRSRFLPRRRGRKACSSTSR